MDWFEDEGFWRDLYPYMFPSERMALAAEQTAQVLALAGLSGPAAQDRAVPRGPAVPALAAPCGPSVLDLAPPGGPAVPAPAAPCGPSVLDLAPPGGPAVPAPAAPCGPSVLDLAPPGGPAVPAPAAPCGPAVLDLCCGPGRHSLEFARAGCTVTGVDRSPFLLDRARERAAEGGLQVEWVREDMRTFRRPAAFDLACSLFTSFGYFEDEEDNLRVLRNVRENLREGGAFVIDVISKERLARYWENPRCTEFGDGTLLLMRAWVRPDWCRLDCQWTVIAANGTHRSFRFDHSIYSGRELKDRLLGCGFRQVRLFGNLGGAPYDRDAARLVAVAR